MSDVVDHDAAQPLADPIDLSMIYAAHARGTDGALDFLFETADDAYGAGRFADYSAAVAALDFDHLHDLAVIVGVAVTGTLVALSSGAKAVASGGVLSVVCVAETSRLSMSTPSFRAYSTSRACSASTYAATPPPFWTLAAT